MYKNVSHKSVQTQTNEYRKTQTQSKRGKKAQNISSTNYQKVIKTSEGSL